MYRRAGNFHTRCRESSQSYGVDEEAERHVMGRRARPPDEGGVRKRDARTSTGAAPIERERSNFLVIRNRSPAFLSPLFHHESFCFFSRTERPCPLRERH